MTLFQVVVTIFVCSLGFMFWLYMFLNFLVDIKRLYLDLKEKQSNNKEV